LEDRFGEFAACEEESREQSFALLISGGTRAASERHALGGPPARSTTEAWLAMEEVHCPFFPGLPRETIRPVTCLKQQARKIGCRPFYEVYE
jgi:hypothetical protein